MIGLGTWAFHVDTMFFKGDAEVKIFDNNGEYGFDLFLPDESIPKFEIKDIKEEGNTLTAIANIEIMSNKDIPISLTFEGNEANGFIKVPFMGKIALKNGKKIG